jgi:hypothetical protein
VVFPNVHPLPMATQLQNLGGISAIVVGAFCENSDRVHSLYQPTASARNMICLTGGQLMLLFHWRFFLG